MMPKWNLPASAGLWLLLATFAFTDGYSPFMKIRHGTSDLVTTVSTENSTDAEDLSTVLADPYTAPLVANKRRKEPIEFLDGFGKNVFHPVYEWKVIDFAFPSLQARNNAIRTKSFIPENNLPLGVARFRNRVFITTPRWNPGVPATLSYLPLPAASRNAPLNPYPDWDFHTTPQNPDCSKLVSVYRVHVDECDRLWVLDAGVIDTLTNLQQVCPPKVLAFDLYNDKLLFSYTLPEDQVKQDSLHTNLVVDIRKDRCNEAFAYIADVWRNGITVFSLGQFKSWRTTNHLYNPNPLASDFNIDNINFQWSDGVFGISLSPLSHGDRMVFFHPMSSFTEFEVPASVLQNETIWKTPGGLATAFQVIGSRGRNGQSATAGTAYNGVQFFTLVHRNAVGCWDMGKPYNLVNLGIAERDVDKLTFPNDLKLDFEREQSIWLITNRLPRFLYSRLDYNVINFRVLQADVQMALLESICDPRVAANLLTKKELPCYQ